MKRTFDFWNYEDADGKATKVATAVWEDGRVIWKGEKAYIDWIKYELNKGIPDIASKEVGAPALVFDEKNINHWEILKAVFSGSYFWMDEETTIEP